MRRVQREAESVNFPLTIPDLSSLRTDWVCAGTLDTGSILDMVFAFYAPVVKLAYTLDSGSSGLTAVEVQLLSGAPR